MAQLPRKLTVALGHAETPTSLAARTAYLNGRSARDFCLDMGFQFQHVVDGRPEALERLAHCARVELGALCAFSFKRTGVRSYEIRGERILRSGLVRARVRVCPHCIADDLSHDGDGSYAQAYQRAYWLVGSIRTCQIHCQPLVEISENLKPNSLHDFTTTLKSGIDRLANLDLDFVSRPPSSLDRYMQSRLDENSHGEQWLDGIRLDAVGKLSEVLGACAIHGVNVHLNALTDDNLYEAGGVGFDIASQGEAGIRALLSKLQDTHDPKARSQGPKTVFRRLYEWLAHDSDDQAYDPLRDIVSRHCIETMPLGPGDELFGKHIEVRKLHSVYTASREYKAHPKRLRKLLHLGGFLSDDYLGVFDNCALFDAGDADAFIRKAIVSYTLRDAAEYLNIPRPYDVDILTRYVRPLVDADRSNLARYAFEQGALDEFMARLSGNAVPMNSSEVELVSLIEARKRACCSMSDIIDRLIAGELSTVRVDAGTTGFLSIRVSVDEVRDLVRLQDHGGLSLRQAEKALAVNTQVLKSLMEAGYLQSQVAINPLNRCPQTIIFLDDIEKFRSTYVSLTVLSRELGVHFTNLKKRLTNIPLAMDREKIGGSFYLRSSLPPL